MSAPQERPQNCGTGHCSCIECVMEPTDGWLQNGGLLYRLTDESTPQNRDEINVTMADGSRSEESRARRAGELLDRIRAKPSLPDQTDSMGIPLSCGKPACSPNNHHPLCKLAQPEQVESQCRNCMGFGWEPSMFNGRRPCGHCQPKEPWKSKVSAAPCNKCGYNGAGYYQPDTHPCVAQPEQEPVAWRELCRRLYVELFHCNQQMTHGSRPKWKAGKEVLDVLADAETALDDAPPQRKPWVSPTAEQMEILLNQEHDKQEFANEHEKLLRELNEAQQRKPLTDEQRDALIPNNLSGDFSYDEVIEIIKKVEAAHGIKE